MKQNKRLYVATNMYISDIQRGIQTAHVVGEMSLTGHPDYEDWARSGKTIIVLNGGYQKNLENLYTQIAAYNKEYPNKSFCLSKFHEEQDALNGALTAVGVIVNEDQIRTYETFSAALDSSREEVDFFLWFNNWRQLKLA